MEHESSGRRPPGPPPGPPPGRPSHASEKKKSESMKVEDILVLPGRSSRPQQIVVIVRGLPGSGKTYVSKLIKVHTLPSSPILSCQPKFLVVSMCI